MVTLNKTLQDYQDDKSGLVLNFKGGDKLTIHIHKPEENLYKTDFVFDPVTFDPEKRYKITIEEIN